MGKDPPAVKVGLLSKDEEGGIGLVWLQLEYSTILLKYCDHSVNEPITGYEFNVKSA